MFFLYVKLAAVFCDFSAFLFLFYCLNYDEHSNFWFTVFFNYLFAKFFKGRIYQTFYENMFQLFNKVLLQID